MGKTDSWLRDWAYAVLREIESSGLSSETITYKLMRCGTMVHTGIIPVPNYWPTHYLAKVNDAVWSLPVADRNLIVMRRILAYSYRDIARECEKSVGWAYKHHIKAEEKVGRMLKP